MAWRAPGSLLSPSSSEGSSWRVKTLLGDSFGLHLASDLRLKDLRPEVGSPCSCSAVDVDTDLARDLEAEVVDIADSDGLDLVAFLVIRCGFILGLAMEVELEFMNPARVG